jgi:hypothetical protein
VWDGDIRAALIPQEIDGEKGDLPDDWDIIDAL